MNTIKVRFTDIRRWAASQLTGLAMTIYNDDEQPDDNALKDAYANMENVYIQSLTDWCNDVNTQNGLLEIARKMDVLFLEELKSLKEANLNDKSEGTLNLAVWTEATWENVAKALAAGKH